MKVGKRVLLISALSGAVGGGLGSVCGSASLLVVISVGAISAVIVAWLLSGMIR